MSERPTVTATYDSECPVCLAPIYEGETIGLIEPEGDWAHLSCAEEELPWPEEES